MRGGVSEDGDMAMGRWSELRRVRVVQVDSSAIEWLTMVRSGEEGLPLVGSRVGWSSLRIIIIIMLASMASIMRQPRAAARSSVVVEYQALLWALKSPIMSVVVPRVTGGQGKKNVCVWPAEGIVAGSSHHRRGPDIGRDSVSQIPYNEMSRLKLI